jgi:hypothetical protein
MSTEEKNIDDTEQAKEAAVSKDKTLEETTVVQEKELSPEEILLYS